MGWYDVFANFYDNSLEALYAEQRIAAADALDLAPGQLVLDVPCGTGQSFDAIAPRILPGGTLLGVDFSTGMLARAEARARRLHFDHVRVLHADVHQLDARAIEGASGRSAHVDRAQVFLGLTAFPRWEEAFERVWSLLAPGGRIVIVDAHAARPGFRGHMVNLVARADIRRKVWRPLERVATDFVMRDLPSRPEHGGRLVMATGVKR